MPYKKRVLHVQYAMYCNTKAHLLHDKRCAFKDLEHKAYKYTTAPIHKNAQGAMQAAR